MEVVSHLSRPDEKPPLPLPSHFGRGTRFVTVGGGSRTYELGIPSKGGLDKGGLRAPDSLPRTLKTRESFSALNSSLCPPPGSFV